MEYHNPVLAKECIDALNIQESPDGVYIDATFGGGGHSRLILNELGEKGQLHGFDQDQDVVNNVPDDSRFTLNQHNFRYVKRFMRLHGIKEVDGIMADLGVSSHQLNEGSRGFSFRFNADLDMRMNQSDSKTAAEVLNEYREEQLQHVLGMYGEVRNAKSLAQAIVQARDERPLKTIGDFLNVLGPMVRGQRNRYLAQVFQALRIEVNDEMGALEDFFKSSYEILKPGGRLVILSYHSLEDRITKNFFKTGNIEGTVEKDFFGNIARPYKVITKKPVLPSQEEIRQNSRARSAKLRIAQKK